MAAKKRTKGITAKKRRSLPQSTFGLPGKRKYPTDTKKRARAAKAYSTQQYKKGRLSKASKDRVHAKANRRLARKR